MFQLVNDKFERPAWPALLLVLFGLLLYLPGLVSLPPTDRDEARFAQASKQMCESGDYVNIRFQDEPRYKKPIGIYWLQAAAVNATTGPGAMVIWPYRLPSLAGALLAVLLTYGLGRGLVGDRAAFWGGMLLAGCLLLTVEAHLAKTDAMLLAAVTAMQGALGRAYLDWRQGVAPKRAITLLFWVACGAGILLKGPVPPAIALLTILVLRVADRRGGFLRTLRPLSGLLLMLLIVLPWFVAINQVSHGAFLRQAVGHDLLPKLIGGQESHGAWPGFYLLLFTALFWPGSLLAWAAFWPSWRARGDAAVRFLLAWLIPAWLLFELVPTKLPHYILPVFPAVALLTGRFLGHLQEGLAQLEGRPFRVLRWPILGLWGLVTLLLGAGLAILPPVTGGGLSLPGLLAAAAAAALLFGLPRLLRRRRATELVVAASLAAVLVLVPALGWVLPGLQGPWLSNAVVTALQRHGAKAPYHLATVDYREPSLVFLAGTGTRMLDAAAAAIFLRDNPDGWVLVGDKQLPRFLDAARDAGLAPAVVERISGFNYSKGRRMRLNLYRTGSPVEGVPKP